MKKNFVCTKSKYVDNFWRDLDKSIHNSTDSVCLSYYYYMFFIYSKMRSF